MIVLLCAGVVMQMLGMAVTLWNPGEAVDIADPLTTSVLEGFAIPSSLATFRFHRRPWPFMTSYAHTHGLLLASVPFHPPTL